MPGRGSYGPGGRWIHDRAHRIMQDSPETPKSVAYAVATQQAHKVGKSPKGFRTPSGVATAKQKMRGPMKEYQKTATIAGFFDEIEKIAAWQKIASTGMSLEELVKIAEHDQEIYELLKQAGILERMGRGAQKLYHGAQVGAGNLMSGPFAHAGEHAAQKLMTTASPTKALMVAATDPHAQKAVLRAGRRAGQAVSQRAKSVAQRARTAMTPAPGMAAPRPLSLRPRLAMAM